MHTRLFALAAAVAACGGSAPIGPSKCTVTFSGAITGSGTCAVAGGNGYKNGSSGNGVGIGLTATVAGINSFAFALDLGTTAVTAGTYSNTTTSASAGTAITSPSNQAWVQSHSSNQSDQGSYTLTITDLGPGVTSSGGTAYVAMHGSLNATLTPVTGSGASGNVTVSVSF